MPEITEVLVTSHYLLTKIKNRYISNLKVLSGRYTHQEIEGKELLDDYSPVKIKNISTKGKLMWFELEWIPVYSRTYMKNKSLYDNVNFYRGYPTKYLTQTQLSYDKRINYGCVNSGYPLNTFTTDLNLGISSDKYAIKQKYIDSSNSIYQKINLIALNPYYDVVNVRDYFVYNEPQLDVFENQRLDKII